MFAYSFSHGSTLDPADRRALLGGKGASLVAMTEAALPVPPGFTLTTTTCKRVLAGGWTDECDRALFEQVRELEGLTGKSLGSTDRPLLVSVRSGAPISMPGMMDTVLNVGMNDEVEAALARAVGDARFAADTHRRFLLSYAEIVLGADGPTLAAARNAMDVAGIRRVLGAAGLAVPTDPVAQLRGAVRAVFDSWHGERARHYRRIEGIDDDLGTAATVQAMVFGNLGDRSGTGVAFTRNPSTGERRIMGDFLANAQGEDVVAGGHATVDLHELATTWPGRWDELCTMAATLEHHYRDMVDIEFTIEAGVLWMLQARVGKRTPLAAFRVAVDMAEDPDFPLDRSEAVDRCRPHLDDPPQAVAAEGDDLTVLASGLAACPGVASGVLCVDVEEAVRLGDQGVSLVLARQETSPADVAGMAAAKGIFTTLGGTVSHAAVVARSWGTPAVVGAAEAEVDEHGVTVPGGRIAVGELVTVDGGNGVLLAGAVDATGVPVAEVVTVGRWAAELDAAGAPAADSGAVAGAPDAASTDATATSGGDGPLDPEALRFGVVHALRIKGMGTVEVLAAMTGTGGDAVTGVLRELEAAGEAKFMEPRELWLITPDGRTAHEPLLAEQLVGVDLGRLPYERFLSLNGEFKQLCTDWQLRDGHPNDHSDPAYDGAVVDRLGVLHDDAAPILDQHADVLPWLTPYRGRLTAALTRLRDGDPKALTGVMCDSYHDIWMELHEDLIVTQGIDRVAEGSG
ncbi:MAG: pyruvate, phosphate dikinase [Actinomycetota bacterium]